jgi:hypothetical protein
MRGLCRCVRLQRPVEAFEPISKPPLRRRFRAADTEPVTVVLRNRRRERKAAQLARLLLTLDSMAGAERAWRPRRVVKLSVGTTR